MTRDAAPYREVAEAAWAWTLSQVRRDDGPWIPESVAVDGDSSAPVVPDQRDGMHSGIGGLAHTLAEIRLDRAWTAAETELAEAIAERLTRAIPAATVVTYFDGLVSIIGALAALGRADGVRAAVVRLQELAAPDGWPQPYAVPPRYLPGARINDLTLGTAGVLLGAVWAARLGVPEAPELADRAGQVLLEEAEKTATGLNWPFVPSRFCAEPRTQMPNLSHGVAGVAAALAAAGAQFAHADLVAAAGAGAEHLISLGTTDGRGFAVPRYVPGGINDEDEFTFTWCHGSSGTSLLFAALDTAGVPEVAGEPPAAWHRRSLHTTRTSGLPARLHPGFWDNDGRCCGTAGVGDIFLDSWHRTHEPDDLAFALRLADTLVERAIRTGPHAYWRFVEHRNAEPLLPPGVGWMQGSAGIAAFLFHAARVAADEHAPAQPRMDTWWVTQPRPGA